MVKTKGFECPIVFFRIGYMEDGYNGPARIKGGGKYVSEHEEGGEMWNFREEAGYYYGYVATPHGAGIDLARLKPARNWSKGDGLDGVDVVFIARRPGIGQVIIGWHLDAIVFHKEYGKRRGRKGDQAEIFYVCKASSKNARLLDESRRTFKVPRGKDFIGQSNVWYPKHGNDKVSQFIKKVRKYIYSYGKQVDIPSVNKGSRDKRKPDRDLNLKVEEVAIERTKKHYEDKGYEVIYVNKDNRGWDLEAFSPGSKRRQLLLEVKGHSGSIVQFELTPNEYSQMQKRYSHYRICVVRNALTDPDLKIFRPQEGNNGDRWILIEEGGSERIKLIPKVAARAARIEI